MEPIFSMMPPSWLAWLRPRFRWRFTFISPSTRTRPAPASTSRTVPELPRSWPAMTLTLSPLRIVVAIRGPPARG